MDLNAKNLQGTVVVSIAGRLDHAGAPTLKDKLAPLLLDCHNDGHPMVLDLSGVDYVSSVGLRVFMLAAKQVGSQGGKLVVAGLQPIVKEIFEISRFDRVFQVCPTVEDAVLQLSSGRDGP